MNLKQWCELDELIHIRETDEQYKQYAGYHYSETLIEHLSRMRLYNSKIFLESFTTPRNLLLLAVKNIAFSETKRLELQLHNVRNTKITSSKHLYNGSSVNWSTWRQFNSLQSNHLHRKDVFDEFITKTAYVKPIIEERFSLIKQSYLESQVKDRFGQDELDPLSGYLENEDMTYDKLTEFIKYMGSKAKKPFREALMNVGKRVLGKEPEYYDDFYLFRSKVFSDIENNFSSLDPVVEVKKILKTMHFSLSKIHFDVENRRNKYPSPICFFVKIPDDIRVLYKNESPYFDLQGCFHEIGHAMHASSLDAHDKYWNKYTIPMGIEEIFSTFLERLTKNPNYLMSLLSGSNRDLKKESNMIKELVIRNNFTELFFVVFYTANSLMKLEYWKHDLSIDEASELYSKLIKEYVGFEVPGEYWLLHHILPEDIVYVPSYLLAAVRAKELDVHMQNRYGDKWWTVREAGRELRDIMKPGTKIDLSLFSELNSTYFMNEITTGQS